MLNKKIILINGMTRSGSNVLWNILQSHPKVCSPVGETIAVLHPKGPGLHRVSRFLYTRCGNAMIHRYIDARLFRAKLDNLCHADNRYKTENELYSEGEIKDAALCLKALNEDIYLTDLFYSMYEQIHSIGLVRNGYAVCEGLVRRGEKPAKAGQRYTRYMARILEDSQRLRNYTIVKFEDLIQRPFETAESLFRFCDLDPVRLEKLRLKSKTVMSADGSHSKTYRSAGGKYWFDRVSVADFLDPAIDRSQSTRLSGNDKAMFEKQAKPILDHFSYA